MRGLVATFMLAAILAGGLTVFALNRESQAQVALSNEELAHRDAEASADYASNIALAAAASCALLQKNPEQAIALAMAASSISANPVWCEKLIRLQFKLLFGKNSLLIALESGLCSGFDSMSLFRFCSISSICLA